MADFVRTTRATLRTQVGTYSLSSTLAGIEVVFERHRPEGRARFLPEYFKIALAENDEDLAVRVVKAAHLVSLLGQPSIALDAIDPMADVVDEHPALEKPIVEVLANIRLFEDAAVDSRLASRYQPQLARLVHATSPTVSANEFPTMIDFFVNHQLIHSEDGATCDLRRLPAGAERQVWIGRDLRSHRVGHRTAHRDRRQALRQSGIPNGSPDYVPSVPSAGSARSRRSAPSARSARVRMAPRSPARAAWGDHAPSPRSTRSASRGSSRPSRAPIGS